MNNLAEDKKRIAKIINILLKEYPEPKTALNYSNPFQLLIATILSAQCTDERVNLVTKDLFKKYKKPQDFLSIPPEELEKDIYSTGFYKQKAKSIIKCCTALVDKYNGKVPDNFEELCKLPGVGRKTASVVAGNAFNIPSIAVDTHVTRLTNLLGFVNTSDPLKIELRLRELLPEKYWIASSNLLILHGRKVCIARRPKCEQCVICKYCPSCKLTTN
ncbi:endonuclease III [Rosettibacter firmus]|uniref:endonuclease III n=1 Tax=Rosettibacter firmus TaxID=3111522 RepID=UPI00336BD22C